MCIRDRAEAHEKLDEKVESIVGETFAGLIDESMLNEELAEKLNSKADQTTLNAAKSENEAAHAGFQTKITAKCEIVTGSYNGSGENNTKMISLGSVSYTHLQNHRPNQPLPWRWYHL